MGHSVFIMLRFDAKNQKRTRYFVAMLLYSMNHAIRLKKHLCRSPLRDCPISGTSYSKRGDKFPCRSVNRERVRHPDSGGLPQYDKKNTFLFGKSPTDRLPSFGIGVRPRGKVHHLWIREKRVQIFQVIKMKVPQLQSRDFGNIRLCHLFFLLPETGNEKTGAIFISSPIFGKLFC